MRRVEGACFFWEEPIWHQEGEIPLQAGGGLGLIHRSAAGITVVVGASAPISRGGIDFEVGQRHLLNELLATFEIERYITWYYHPDGVGLYRPPITRGDGIRLHG